MRCRFWMARVAPFGSLFALGLLVQSARAEEPLWSNEVRRIDPASQDYQRLPDREQRFSTAAPPPGSFRVRGFFRIHDSVTFTYNGNRYRLANVLPIPNNQICIRADGSRWPCGLEARTTLRSALEKRGTSCVPLGESDSVTQVRCGSGDQDVAALLVEHAFAVSTRSVDRRSE